MKQAGPVAHEGGFSLPMPCKNNLEKKVRRTFDFDVAEPSPGPMRGTGDTPNSRRIQRGCRELWKTHRRRLTFNSA